MVWVGFMEDGEQRPRHSSAAEGKESYMYALKNGCSVVPALHIRLQKQPGIDFGLVHYVKVPLNLFCIHSPNIFNM